MQDENSGKDGRRLNEWLANRADSRRRAREAAEDIANRHPEPQDPPMTRADMPVALMVWAVAPILAILLGYWIAS